MEEKKVLEPKKNVVGPPAAAAAVGEAQLQPPVQPKKEVPPPPPAPAPPPQEIASYVSTMQRALDRSGCRNDEGMVEQFSTQLEKLRDDLRSVSVSSIKNPAKYLDIRNALAGRIPSHDQGDIIFTNDQGVDLAVIRFLGTMFKVKPLGGVQDPATVEKKIKDKLNEAGITDKSRQATMFDNFKAFIKMRLLLNMQAETKLLEEGANDAKLREELGEHIESLKKRDKEFDDLRKGQDESLNKIVRKLLGSGYLKLDKEEMEALTTKGHKVKGVEDLYVISANGDKYCVITEFHKGTVDKVIAELAHKKTIVWHNIDPEYKDEAEIKCLQAWKKVEFQSHQAGVGQRLKGAFRSAQPVTELPVESTLSYLMPDKPGDWVRWLRNIDDRKGIHWFETNAALKEKLIQKVVDHATLLREFWDDVLKNNDQPMIDEAYGYLDDTQKRMLGSNADLVSKEKQGLEKRQEELRAAVRAMAIDDPQSIDAELQKNQTELDKLVADNPDFKQYKEAKVKMSGLEAEKKKVEEESGKLVEDLRKNTEEEKKQQKELATVEKIKEGEAGFDEKDAKQKELPGKIGKLENDKKTLEKQQNELKSKLEGIDGKIAEETKKITALQQKIPEGFDAAYEKIKANRRKLDQFGELASVEAKLGDTEKVLSQKINQRNVMYYAENFQFPEGSPKLMELRFGEDFVKKVQWVFDVIHGGLKGKEVKFDTENTREIRPDLVKYFGKKLGPKKIQSELEKLGNFDENFVQDVTKESERIRKLGAAAPGVGLRGRRLTTVDLGEVVLGQGEEKKEFEMKQISHRPSQ